MSAESGDEPEQGPAPSLGVLLHSRSYLALLVFAAALGIPLSLLAFGYLAAVHQLGHLVWDGLPAALGYEDPPAWWPIVTMAPAGVLVALVAVRLPGAGGHAPALGLAAGMTPPAFLPGIVLAATAGLVLGAVLGPEAPLMAVGSGLALLAARGTKIANDVGAGALISAAGSCAAISAIFGNPLVAVILIVEVSGLARRQTMLVVLPCLLSSGVGSIVFTGLGGWTGVEIGSLSIPDLAPAPLRVPELVWTLPLAALVAVIMWASFMIGNKTMGRTERRPVTTTVSVGLATGGLAALYAVVTDQSPTDVTLSGQATLSVLASQPELWSTGALVLLLLCKGLAFGLCLGAFRGGPVFPAVFLGAVCGVLASNLLPGVGLVPGLAIGMAAGATVLRLPVASVLLVVLLLGDAALSQMPVVILAAVTALIVEERLTTLRSAAGADGQPASHPG